MEHDWALQLIAKMLLTAALVSAPLLIANLLVGLAVSVIQVVTQVQEMTLTFVPKLAVSIFVTLLLGAWMLGTLERFALDLFEIAASAGH